MRKRTLGGQLEVSAIGYGAWVLAGPYGQVDEEQGIAAIKHALDLGVTLIDTADAYGVDGSNETLVGRAISGRRDEVVIATKWGIAAGEHSSKLQHNFSNDIWIDGRAERAREAAEASLRRLGVETIDVWFLHFPDPGRPIEETVGAMAAVVEAGYVRHLGLSNVTAEELRRAHAVHPITAVQNEYSLWTRNVERDLLPAARELGVGVVPWAPLGTGFLTGLIELEDGDFRSNAPRFQGENLHDNMRRFAPLGELADELEISPAQLALAWLLHQGDDVVPIPGTRRPVHLEENVRAVDVGLDDRALARIESLLPAGLAAGDALLP